MLEVSWGATVSPVKRFSRPVPMALDVFTAKGPPGYTVADHGVKNCQQLSHTCCDSDFVCFAGGFKTFVERLYNWIVPGG